MLCLLQGTHCLLLMLCLMRLPRLEMLWLLYRQPMPCPALVARSMVPLPRVLLCLHPRSALRRLHSFLRRRTQRQRRLLEQMSRSASRLMA